MAGLWPYLLVAFLYLATSPYHRGLNNPNEMVRLYMSAAWVDDGSFDIGLVTSRWGMVDDKAVREGRLYSSKAPLQSLIGVPAYAISRPILDALGAPIIKRTQLFVVRILGSALFGIAFAALLIAYARRRSQALGAPRALGTALGLSAALGTMLYPYAITFTGHLLAAFAAGGCYLALLGLSRSEPGASRWRWMALLAGFAGGATPFAEYPAALVAAPALAAAFFMVTGAKRRAQFVGWLALGGSLPFGLGLWAHYKLWGSPLKTGYAFLENKDYVELHGQGFFGVSTPDPQALAGALFSPGTGLFFFSPILLIGLIMLVRRPFIADTTATEAAPQIADIPKGLAIAGVLAFVFSVYFIASHSGWRGGWTVGPRYIIALAPVLWVWSVEAAAFPRLRPWLAAFGALSVVCTGFAAALYPHLSDVFANPLASFLLPTYLHGETTYGLGHWLGLQGHAANAVHVLPLLAAMVFIGIAGSTRDGASPTKAMAIRAAIVLGVLAVSLTAIGFIPESDEGAARRENRRLWGFWEPAGPGEGPTGVRRHRRKGRVYSARSRWRDVEIRNLGPDGSVRPCKSAGRTKCVYGDHPWQHFGPETLTMDGRPERILFMHPIAGATVEATIPYRNPAKVVVLRYGLGDDSVTSSNQTPVQFTLHQGDDIILEAEATNRFGLQAAEMTLTSTLPFILEVRSKNDGARVFGWDLELYK